MAAPSNDNPVALCLPGGGARTAYQVGVLAAIAEQLPEARFPILTGISGGAINAAFLANQQHSFSVAAKALTGAWQALTLDRVFHTGAASVFWNVLRWGGQLMSGGATFTVRGLVETEPLREILVELLGASGEGGVGRNIEQGRLTALAVTTTNYSTGQAETFVQGRIPSPWERPYRRSVRSVITVDHVLASAAIPIIFPAVKIGEAWHGDGGVRLTAPLSPAVHLGAHRILTVSTMRTPLATPLPIGALGHYPSPARIAGVLLNAMFLDNVDFDATNLERINQLLTRCPEGFNGLRPVGSLVLRPSEDLGEAALEFERELPSALRYMSRGLGTGNLEAQDLLATLLFSPGFIGHLIELGRKDAAARMEEIRAFLFAE